MKRANHLWVFVALASVLVLAGVFAVASSRKASDGATKHSASEQSPAAVTEQEREEAPDEESPEPGSEATSDAASDATEASWTRQADADVLEDDEVYDGDTDADEGFEYGADAADTSAEEAAAQEETTPDTAIAGEVAEPDEPLFVMPEQADYEPEVALVGVPEGMSAQELANLLASVDSVANAQVSDADIERGLAKVELAPGVDVEAAINELLATGAIESAQPNYRYRVASDPGTAADLRRALDDPLAAASEDVPTTVATDETAAEIQADDTTYAISDAASDGTEEATMQADPAGTEGDPATAIDPAQGEQVVEATDEPTDVEQEPAPTDAAIQDDAAALPDEGTDPAAIEGDPAAIEAGSDAGTSADAGTETPAADPDAVPVDDPAIEQAADPDADTGSDAEARQLGAAALIADLVKNKSINDTLISEQWELDSIHAGDAWELVKTNRSVTVAIMDEGFNIAHEDLKANVVAPYNSVTGGTNVDICTSNHGNHVAGLIAGVANNGKGIAGTSYNARIMPIEVIDSSYTASSESIVDAYDYVLRNQKAYNIRVVNLSMAAAGDSDWLDPDDAILAAIDKAYAAGIVTVGAAGNASANSSNDGKVPYICYPADYETVVSVINMSKELKRYSSSNYNAAGETCKNISAPGTSLMSTVHGSSEYSTMSGTSMAAPVVSATLALEFAAMPSLTADQAVRILYDTTTDIGADGWDRETGYGEVNAYGAVSYITGGVLKGPAYLAAGDSGSFAIEGGKVSFSFSSSNPSVATITAAGRVTAKAAGTTTITARSADGALTRSVTLTVFGEISGASSLSVPASATLRVAKPTTMAWTWKSSNTAVAKVGASSGTVTAVGPGTATITATLVADTSVRLTKTVTVTKGNIANATVSAISDKTYRGGVIKPAPTVKMGSVTLTRGKAADYTLTYKNNVNIGTASITITGKNKYTGTKTVTFRIVGVAPAANLTGWHSPDLGKTYYWYRNGKQRTTSGWIVTKMLPKGGSTSTRERYWLGAGGALAMGRMVRPSEGATAYWAYARAAGYVVRGRCKLGTRIYLAENDGHLLSPGWHTTADFGQGEQRYYVEKRTRTAVVGYSTSGYPHYTTKKGYVIRGAVRVGKLVYLAHATTGRMPSRTGWYVGRAYGQGLQRYYFERLASGAYVARIGYSTAGYPHYTTKKGYVLRGTLRAADGYTYVTNADGRVTRRTKTK